MALSDKKILEHKKAGTIVIEPFTRKNLATSSYDVTLGEWFFREQQPKYNHSLYNIWSKEHTEHVWGANKVERAVIAKEAFKKYKFEWDGISPNDKVIMLRPGETILAHTNEFIGGRDIVTTMMKARSSMGRNFIEVCKCAGWGDVGYVNRWTMEITNNSKNYLIPLVVGRRIAQIIFFETGSILKNDYTNTGKYQASRDIQQLKKSWGADSDAFEIMGRQRYQEEKEIMTVGMFISLIAAIGKNRELGKGGKLLWHIPEDMRRFKALTTGHPVIMGRKTWESLPEKFRPLPGRTNIVVTRQNGYKAPGATVTDSFENARAVAARADSANEIFVIGGGELYAAALPHATRLYLTLIDATAEADTFFPPYENDFTIVKDESGSGEPPHRFLTLERK